MDNVVVRESGDPNPDVPRRLGHHPGLKITPLRLRSATPHRSPPCKWARSKSPSLLARINAVNQNRQIGYRLIAAAVTAAVLVLMATAAPADAHTLTYKKARAAAQKKADRFAGQRTSIEWMFRRDRHRYSARADWEEVDPDGCQGCGYDPVTGTFYDTPVTKYCSATVIVRYRSHRSRRPTARIDEHACF